MYLDHCPKSVTENLVQLLFHCDNVKVLLTDHNDSSFCCKQYPSYGDWEVNLLDRKIYVIQYIKQAKIQLS